LEDKIVQRAVVTILNEIHENDFLEFMHMSGKNGKRGYFLVRRKTVKKRMRAKQQAVKAELRWRARTVGGDRGMAPIGRPRISPTARHTIVGPAFHSLG
jgi:hypothetical protein